jgi:NADP-dependent 3-hydroxy acid dehydrogenase YdfG
VITGASSGIGAALAELLGRHGMSVVLVARRKDALEEVAARCGSSALVTVADCTDRTQVKRVVETAIARFGHIDVWVNNAGQGITRMPTELTDGDVDEIVRQNVKTTLYGVQEVLPHFKARNSGQIINIGSLLGRVPFFVARSAYSGAKHFVSALTAMMREEVQQTHPGIQFSIVTPGVVRTDFGRHAIHGGPDSRDLPHSQSAEEVAEVIASVIASRKPDVYTRHGFHERIANYYAKLGEDP